mgnify:CR=1 FL=1|jgi:multiple sugar transport system permease protein
MKNMTKKLSGKKHKNFVKFELPYILLLLPFAICFITFTVIPVLSSIVLSFTDFNMVKINHFVGFENYIRMFTEDEVFTIALKNTLIIAVVTAPIGYILSFVIAWLINDLPRGLRALVTFIVYSPALTGNIYFIWTYIFSGDSRGLFNDVLLKLGLISDPISWLSDTKYNFTIVLIVTIWLSFGSGFLSFVAGLKALNRTYYEAAAIDGLKNRWQELYYVTFPQMGPQLMFGAVMSISGAFAVGAVNAALTGSPSTDYSTHTLLLHLTDVANIRYEMGYASAIAVVMFLIMVALWKIISSVLKNFNE